MVPFGIASWVSHAPRGALVLVSMAKELRVRRLVEDYCGEEKKEELKECGETSVFIRIKY